MRRLLALAAVFLLAATACTGGGSANGPSETQPAGGESNTSLAPSTTSPTTADANPAPEFPDGLDWLNTAAPLRMEDLAGKAVLLDFWTYGCINCIHIIPDLKRLEEEYPDELVVIGVHSAKFETEGATENIREIVLRYGIEHPVVNDPEFEVWGAWGARAWPTVVLVDPEGNVVGGHEGEGVYDVVAPVLAGVVADFDARGSIDRSPLQLSLESDGRPRTLLSYPGKVLAAPGLDSIFVADTGNHRIVRMVPATGEVTAVYGAGSEGYEDGAALSSRFNSPQGLALSLVRLSHKEGCCRGHSGHIPLSYVTRQCASLLVPLPDACQAIPSNLLFKISSTPTHSLNVSPTPLTASSLVLARSVGSAVGTLQALPFSHQSSVALMELIRLFPVSFSLPVPLIRDISAIQ